MTTSFDALVDEASEVPIEGWNFAWLDGRATEERPPWGYSGLLARRAEVATSLLDLQTGGGEMLTGLPTLPALTAATEAFPPNAERAAVRLVPRGASLVLADDRPLPFADRSFELVASRHPVAPCFEELARVLEPGGHYLSQQVGPRSMVELTDFFLGP